MLTLKQNFGEVLRLLRSQRGLTQQSLAERCDLDETYISLLERGRRQPTLSTIVALAKALEIDPCDFFIRMKENEDSSRNSNFGRE